MNNSINAVGREDKLPLPLVATYCLVFISTRCEQVSEADVLCNTGTMDWFKHFIGREEERKAKHQQK